MSAVGLIELYVAFHLRLQLSELAHTWCTATDDVALSTQTFAKRLYRFMRRAISKWPEQRSTAPLVSLYLAYIAPW